jgi:hypothetical protein
VTDKSCSGCHLHNPYDDVQGENGNACKEVCTPPSVYPGRPHGPPVLVTNPRHEEHPHQQEHKWNCYGDSHSHSPTGVYELGIGSEGGMHLQGLKVCSAMEPETRLPASDPIWHHMRYYGGEDDVGNCDEVREGDELRGSILG